MSYQDVKDRLYHGHRKIANNTYLTIGNLGVHIDRREPEQFQHLSEHINMRLHSNLVARFYPEYLQLFSAGWYTPTTKDRLNLALNISGIHRYSGGHSPLPQWKKIYQVDYQWYYGNYHRHDFKFYNGMRIDYAGKVIN